MEKKIPAPGEKYIHFKKKPYQVITTAVHSQTGEKMVVYQALYGEFAVFTEPLALFFKEVDRARYPRCEQRYRFEPADSLKQKQKDEDGTKTKSLGMEPKDMEVLDFNGEEIKEAEKAREAWACEGEQANPVLMEFLDAENYTEKCKVLINFESKITDRLIDDCAVTLDVVIPEGNLDNRYQQLLSCLRTMARYENERLR